MRLQLALDVADIEESIEFYSKMFDTPVAKRKEGYANFEIANPPLKLILFETPSNAGGLNHLGVEVETADQVEDAERRIAGEGLDTTGVDDTNCCYAAKTETWVHGPDTRWEWYVKTGDNEQFENVILESHGSGTIEAGCCGPATADVAEEATGEAAACC